MGAGKLRPYKTQDNHSPRSGPPILPFAKATEDRLSGDPTLP